MNLGLHYHTPGIVQDGQIWLPAFFGFFVDSLAQKCHSLTYFANSPVGSETGMMDYKIQSPNVRLIDIGPHSSVPSRTFRALKYLPAIQQAQSELDVLLMRAPTPLLPVFSFVWKKPACLLLVSDELAGIDNLPQPFWRKMLIRVWAEWNHQRQMSMSKGSLVFANSQHLYQKYQGKIPNLVLTQTTTLSTSDFYSRTDTCLQKPVRLLYAGRITRIKGMLEIIHALANLVYEGFDVVFDMVGMLDDSDPLLGEIEALAQTLGVSERVHYHGYKSAGDELLQYYRRADIYVIASQSSNEGFPRTIWEAMASSTPVVATAVGSIPAFAKDSALLVPPKDVFALTGALRSLLLDSSIRQKLIRQGALLAQNNTLEKRAEELVQKIQNWLTESN